ncbi:MAG TPA: RtcB family protein [Phycisphaerales bacterium]|nr:RtcB family protein [Phycisphaerales bacterium]
MANCPYNLWGTVGEDFDQPSLDQLRNACSLPVSVAAAMMPDAHVGYGLPIGGVLATRNAVIPYAVGVDIACRMKLTVLDVPVESLEKERKREKLAEAIESWTRFGVGSEFEIPHDHPVLDAEWGVSHITAGMKDRARKQLGTSGSGNHFVEFGLLTVGEHTPRGVKQQWVGGSNATWDLAPGRYVALLSHSGSRGTGAQVCNHYSALARNLHPELQGEIGRLAWLDLDTREGQEYWNAMNLMGEYAAANHACIHRAIARHLGAQVLADVENHHNFAWKEKHTIVAPDGVAREEELVVHRKGATPAGKGVMGVIPGSMAAPGFVVVGKGGAGSLDSASHGAGRKLSRTKAREKFRSSAMRGEMEKRGITLLSAGGDEAPGAYKDIERVMSQQRDLVEPVARFDPLIVKMAPDGERAED